MLEKKGVTFYFYEPYGNRLDLLSLEDLTSSMQREIRIGEEQRGTGDSTVIAVYQHNIESYKREIERRKG